MITKIPLSKLASKNLYLILRRLGYAPIFDNLTKKKSYVKKINPSAHYPRLHLYLKLEKEDLVISLHLDQTPTRHKDQRAHQAEYQNSPFLKQEFEKIKKYFLKNSSSLF